MPSPPTRVAVPGPETPVAELSEVKPRHAAKLQRLGITTVRDLLFHLPRRYEDSRDVRPLRELRPGPDPQAVRATVTHISMRPAHRGRRMMLIQATVEDDGARANCIWFNNPFMLCEDYQTAFLLLFVTEK